MAIRFANKRRQDYLNQVAENSAEVARNNGVVLVGMYPDDSSGISGRIVGRAGSAHIYGKTPSSVLSQEVRNLDQFGNVKFS